MLSEEVYLQTKHGGAEERCTDTGSTAMSSRTETIREAPGKFRRSWRNERSFSDRGQQVRVENHGTAQNTNTCIEELIEIEDLRTILEDIISNDLCPTHGAAQHSFNEHCDFNDVRHNHWRNQFGSWNSWPPDQYTNHSFVTQKSLTTSLFHNHYTDVHEKSWQDLPIPQRRKLQMTGWGDEISQYYIVQSMMKLSPAQVMHMYEHAVTKLDVEAYIINHCDGGDWFWDNGQTFLDTWSLVLYKRGEVPAEVRGAILGGEAGVTRAGKRAWSDRDDGEDVQLCV